MRFHARKNKRGGGKMRLRGKCKKVSPRFLPIKKEGVRAIREKKGRPRKESNIEKIARPK